MMEEEEETLFDQENLLGRPDETSREKAELKRKLAKTGALSMAFFCLGLCIAIPGPTLFDLGKMVGRDTHHMVLVFTARSLGYLLGSVAGGVLGDIWDQQLLLALTLGATAVATAGIPWCTALLSMAVLIAVHGVAIGVLDSGGNVFCIRIWGKQSPSYMQLLHFAFGIGAFLAPLIARPFLSSNTSLIGLNDSVALPYTLEIQAFNSLPDTITGGDGKDEDERRRRDLSHLLQYEDFSQHSSSSAWGFHRSRRQGASQDSDPYSPGSIIGQGDKRNNMSETDVGENMGVVAFTNDTTLSSNTTTTTATPTTTLAPPPPQPVPKKPKTISGESLNPKHADGEPNNAKLADIIHNPQKDLPPGVAASGTVSPITTAKVAEVNGSKSLGNVTHVSRNGSTSDGDKADIDSSSGKVNLTSPFEAQGKTTPNSLSGPNVPTAAATTTESTTTTTTPSATTTSTTTTTTTTPTTTQSTTTTTPTTTQSTSTTTTQSATSTTTTPTPASTTDMSNADRVTVSNPDSSVIPLHPEKDNTPLEENGNAKDPAISNSTTNSTTGAQDTLQFFFETVRNMSKIQFAYLLIGILLGINTAVFLSLYLQDRAAHRSGPLTTPLSHEELTRPPKSNCFVFIFLGLLFLFFFTYVGMEVTYGGLLPTFSLDFPGVVNSPAQGATLVALFWGSLAAGRGTAIFIARWFKPPCMMVVDLSLTLTGALVLVTGISADPKLLWVGTVTLGLGMSSLFPTAMSWAHCYYPLSGRAAAVFVAGCGIGEMTIPAITGQLYHSVSQMVLMYVVLTLSSFLVLLFAVLQILAFYSTKGYGNKFGGAPRSHSGFMRLESSEDMADALDMGVMGETVVGGEDGVTDIPQGRIEDLTSVARSKRGGEEERRAHRQNGAVDNGDGYEVTEFTKLVELSD